MRRLQPSCGMRRKRRQYILRSTGLGFETTLAACYQGINLSSTVEKYSDLSRKRLRMKIISKRHCCSHDGSPHSEECSPSIF
ncbi:hypothetical protein NPIL_531271 [Nephila pilipes]|uniref:Uncharacterized protein n=1 Tax=Nephila pilipes TaxID=299642 RepID=A0A8X6NF62_NEPPI|nr:hypothetical protein NPIL_531271 [Nephila pilipes]